MYGGEFWYIEIMVIVLAYDRCGCKQKPPMRCSGVNRLVQILSQRVSKFTDIVKGAKELAFSADSPSGYAQ